MTYFLFGKGKGISWYRDKNKEDFIRWAVVDAIKLDATFRFGENVVESRISTEFETTTTSSFFVGISYELPLEKLGTPWRE